MARRSRLGPVCKNSWPRLKSSPTKRTCGVDKIIMLETELKERISNLVGDAASSFERMQYGYSDASRWTFRTGHKTYFAKIGTTSRARHELHLEIAAYDKIRGDFMPLRVASEEHNSAPILILEDLSDFHWPPPWHDEQVEAVLAQIANIHKTAAELPTFGERHEGFGQHWVEVARVRTH